MKEPAKFDRVLRRCTVLVLVIHVVFTIWCTEAFGLKVGKMVTDNIPANKLTMISKICICIERLCSATMNMVVAIEILERSDMFTKTANPFKRIPYIKNILLRSIVVILTGVSACFIPKFDLFANFSGAFLLTILSFIVPVYLYDKYFKD